MKHIFMVNRFSLKERVDNCIKAITKVAEELNLDYKIEVNDEKTTTEDILKNYKNSNYIIYAVGGDGILNRVVNAIYGTKNKVACIPAGTGNDFNRSINEFFDEGENLVDLIKCNDKYSINVACFGIDADVGNDNKILHNKFIPRSLQYKVGVLKHIILFKPYTFTMKWDECTKTSKVSHIMLCNGGYYGGGFHVNPNGIYNDGMLDAYIIYATNRRKLIGYLLKLLKGRQDESKLVEHIKSDNFTIIAENEIEGNIDGESIRATKFEMKVIPKALTFYHNRELLNKINKELGK